MMYAVTMPRQEPLRLENSRVARAVQANLMWNLLATMSRAEWESWLAERADVAEKPYHAELDHKLRRES